MGYEEGKQRNQREIYAPSLDEQIAADHPVRVVDAFVDGLEMGGLKNIGRNPKTAGWMKSGGAVLY